LDELLGHRPQLLGWNAGAMGDLRLDHLQRVRLHFGCNGSVVYGSPLCPHLAFGRQAGIERLENEVRLEGRVHHHYDE